MPPPSSVMQQYLDAKRQAGDALLLFRLGDFYELFYEDAQIASRLLNIAVTSREIRRFLLAVASHRFEQIARDMRGYAAKRDALRRDLISADEEDAYLRALIHLGSAKEYSAP